MFLSRRALIITIKHCFPLLLSLYGVFYYNYSLQSSKCVLTFRKEFYDRITQAIFILFIRSLPYYHHTYPCHMPPCSRGVDSLDYDSSTVTPSMYNTGYETPLYATNTCASLAGRHGAHQNSSAQTVMYPAQYDDRTSLNTTVDVTGTALGYYSTNNNTDALVRKRKLLDDMSGQDDRETLKRMLPNNELMYSSLVSTGGFPRT